VVILTRTSALVRNTPKIAHFSARWPTGQLRGTADRRQVDNVTACLQHNIGLGGAAVVTAYQRAER
jgi:hypothetical protein